MTEAMTANGRMREGTMFRKICGLALVGLLLIHTAPVSAEPERPQAPASAKARSTTRRVLWTIVGAGAGFAAGVFLGLNQFDDAINSDRKVWTTAIVGAVGGGVAGALISRNVGRGPSVRTRRPASSNLGALDVSWSAAVPAAPASDDEGLRARVRTVRD
jgi:hypothetical protein